MAEHAYSTPAPDAELLRLGGERDYLISELTRLDALDDRREVVRDQISALPAQTPEGLMVKCVAAIRAYSSNPDDLEVCDFLLNAATMFRLTLTRPWLEVSLEEIRTSASGMRARMDRLASAEAR